MKDVRKVKYKHFGIQHVLFIQITRYGYVTSTSDILSSSNRDFCKFLDGLGVELVIIYVCIYIYIYIYISSCHAASTDIPDPLSPLLPIVHRL